MSYTVNGRKVVRTASFDTELDASFARMTWWKERQAAETAGVLSDGTVSQVLRQWLDQSTARGTTLKAHEWALGKLGPLGAVKVAKLSRSAVADHVASLRASGLSPASVKRAHATLSAGLAWAVSEGLAMVNVAKLIKVSPGQRKVTVPTVEQVRAFLSVLDKRQDFTGAAARFLIESGSRAGEACALTWDRVQPDNDGALVTIDRTVTKLANGRYTIGTATKTGRSRTIRVSSLPATGTGYVFSKSGERFTRPDFLTAAFGKAWDEVVPERDFSAVHSLRHFAATMLANDPDVASVAIRDRLGWSSLRMLDVYGHGAAAADAEASRKLSAYT